MAESVYRVTEVIGVSAESWEQAARNAVETAAGSVRDLRVAEVLRQDVTIEDGGVSEFRVRLGISFKYDEEGCRNGELAPGWRARPSGLRTPALVAQQATSAGGSRVRHPLAWLAPPVPLLYGRRLGPARNQAAWEETG